MRREARIKFDENQIDESQLMDALKKKDTLPNHVNKKCLKTLYG
jgi:hypothetical protein